MNTLQFTVYGKPQPKQRPRIGKGHTYTPDATKSYEQEVAYAALQAMPPESRAVPLWPVGDIEISITFYTRRADSDNVLKAIKDALNNVVYHDDDQVIHESIHKRRLAPKSSEELRAIVTVTLLRLTPELYY